MKKQRGNAFHFLVTKQEHRGKAVVYLLGRRLPLETKHYAFHIGLPCIRTMRNKCLLFKPVSVIFYSSGWRIVIHILSYFFLVDDTIRISVYRWKAIRTLFWLLFQAEALGMEKVGSSLSFHLSCLFRKHLCKNEFCSYGGRGEWSFF